MKTIMRINAVTFSLFLFIILVCFVFYTFYRISDDILNYNGNHDKIVSMKILNKEINSATSSTSHLSHYSVINEDFTEFHQLFKKLKTNIVLHYTYNKELQNYLKNIDNSFNAKLESVEYFKSLNASLISGSSFLFDLQRSIADAHNISHKTKSLVNETMFYLFEFHSGHNIEKIFIEKKLEHLHGVVAVEDGKLLKNFYKQAEVLLATMSSLSKLSQEIQNNKLTEQLDQIHITLDKEFQNNLYREKIIAIFLFLSMLVAWIIFIVMYFRSRKNEKIQQQHASVFANTKEAIVITDPQGSIISVNRAFSDIYGYRLDEVIGKTLNILRSGIQDDMFYKALWSQIKNDGIYQSRIVNKTKDGKNIPIWLTIKAVYNDSNELINYIGVQTDLRALEESRTKAEYLAYHDTLTRLYNRVSFEEFLERTLLSAQRERTKFAVLFIDLDRFKIINDTLGHDIGDRVLIQAAKRLQVILRKSDVISRWGGDEFVVILNDTLTETYVAKIARKIVDEIKKPISVDHHNLNVTASIGIALYPENAKDANTLIKYADSAMYQAKESGKNSFYFYTSVLSDEIQERLQIDLALQNAIEKNEIYMVFQPQYLLKSKQVVSLEALVRWENDMLGFVPPDKFIPIAEENGFITTLGYFIFEESCKKYKEMKNAGVALERVAINVSTIQFRQTDLVYEFLSILERYELKTSEIEIEITERFFMENTENNIKILQEFQDYGFAISIDDFGTGYSSMSYLKRLPVDTIKIDKSFVDDIGLGNRQDDAIVDAIIALATTLHYTIIAEGIETEEQEDFLTTYGCDIGQGYLFSKPVKSEKIIENFS